VDNAVVPESVAGVGGGVMEEDAAWLLKTDATIRYKKSQLNALYSKLIKYLLRAAARKTHSAARAGVVVRAGKHYEHLQYTLQ
jgi:hypothetical protein